MDGHVEPERRLHEYVYWRLILQPERKRAITKQSAGFLTPKRHVNDLADLSADEREELFQVVKDGCRRLCEATGTTYTNQETIGVNQGEQAGQSVFHTHIHLLPVAEEDPEPMKVSSGMGGAFAALRSERMAGRKSL